VAAVAIGLLEPPLPLVITLVIGAWNVHRILALVVAVAWLGPALAVTDDRRILIGIAVGALVASVFGRLLAVRCVEPLASVRQAALSLGFAFAVAVPSALVRLAVGGFASPDEMPRRVMGAVAAITAGVVLSRWLSRPRVPASTVPLGIIAITTTVMVVSAEYLRYQDSDSLQDVADRVAAGLRAAHDTDLGLATAVSEAADGEPLTHDNFALTVTAVLMGNDAISAVALAEELPDGTHLVSDALADAGDAAAAEFSTWLTEEHSDADSTTHSGEHGDLEFAGVATLTSANGERVPHLVHAAPVAHGHDSGGSEGEHYVYIALALPELLARASEPVLAGTGGAAIQLWQRETDADSPLWTQSATSDSGSALDLLDDRDLKANSSLVLHGLTFTVEALPSIDFGIPHTTLQALLLSEGFSGLFAFGALSVATTRRHLTEEGRRRRQAMLGAALAGSRGWAAIVDEADKIRVSNGDRVDEPTTGDVATARYWSGDDVAIARLRDGLVEARVKGESAWTHMWNDPTDAARLRFLDVRAHRLDDSATSADPDVLCFLQCIDVTEEREQSIRTAQAERMASIGELAGGLAHDFNNLLFVALGNLQLIERRAEAIGDDDLKGYAQRSTQAVQRGSEIAKALLTVSGRYPVNESTILVDEFVTEMAPLIEQSLGKDASVNFDLEPRLWVHSDPGRLSSSLINLCVNARHAMESQPTHHVTVSARMGADPTHVDIAVRDSGTGMSPDVAARAFEPFFSTKPRGKGTGLGLASVFSFAQQSGGTARIETGEGRGTTVTISLPLASVDETAATPDTASTDDTARQIRNALVVDDERNLADLVASWLEEAGIATTVAYDAAEALRLVAEATPDLLVTDVNLGNGKNGADIATALRSIDAGAGVVFMTAYADRVRILQESGAPTLAKPFTAAELLEVIRRSGSSSAGA
jgi:signal transduction histidine kinase